LRRGLPDHERLGRRSLNFRESARRHGAEWLPPLR
jgi:hypothetical protein